MQQLKDNIDVAKLGVGVNSVRSKQNGKLILEVDSEADTISIANEIKNKFGNSCIIKIIDRKQPRITIIGVEENLLNINEKEFISNLIKQNNLQNFKKPEETMKVVKRFSTKKGTGSIILQLTSDIQKFLSDKKNIKIGWRSYKFFDFINVKRCFKCWG